MNIGASTSNLYPMQTETALTQLLEAGFKTIEVFINTESESTPKFAQELRDRADFYGARIVSLHSYNSSGEAFLLFSDYMRRLKDGFKMIDRVFKSADIMGASYVVIHGNRSLGPLSDEESVLRYEKIYDIGKNRGVTLLQENVMNYRSADLNYLGLMKSMLGEKAQFVFDLKQSRRCGLSPAQVISAMDGGIRHVHISDNDPNHDCTIPGRGEIDYSELFHNFKESGFNGDIIIELYRKNFETISQLVERCRYLQKFVDL